MKKKPAAVVFRVRERLPFLLALLFISLFGLLVLILVQIKFNSTNFDRNFPLEKQASSSSINLEQNLVVRVNEINKENKTLLVEEMESQKKFRIKVVEKTVINRPTPGQEFQKLDADSGLPRSFEDLRVGSVIQVISKEDPKTSEILTALFLIILV